VLLDGRRLEVFAQLDVLADHVREIEVAERLHLAGNWEARQGQGKWTKKEGGE